MVDENQVADTHQAEAAGEWIDPKVVGKFRVTHGDVASHAFTKTETSKNSQCSGKFLFALGPFFFDGARWLRSNVDELFGSEWNAIDGFGGTWVFSNGHNPRLGRPLGFDGSRSLER